MARMIKIFLFSLLCISTVTYSTQNSDSYSKYDLTKPINNSIARILKNTEPFELKKLIDKIENLNATNIEVEVIHNVKPFSNKFYFSGINITILDFVNPQMHYEFSENKMVIFIDELLIRLEGYVGATEETTQAGFIRSLHFENISLTVIPPSDKQPDNRFKIEISYDNLDFNYVYLPWFREDLALDEQYDLGEKIKQTLPFVLKTNINRNDNFQQALNRSFCTQMSEKEIALTYPDFLHHQQQYYCRLRDVSSFHITLNNITVSGLSNFRSLKFDSDLEQPAYTLIIENIQGNANLCYDTENTKEFELDFKTEYISLFVNQEAHRVYVKAENYSVIETTQNVTLTDRQSEWIMSGIARSIAASVMPSMKICNSKNELNENYETTHPIKQLFGEISDKFRWNTMNESYTNWTPFDGNFTATEITSQVEDGNYSILIYNLTIEPQLSNRYPYQMECHFFERLGLLYEIDGNATGKIFFKNKSDELVSVDFIARFSFGEEIIKRAENDEYEFKTWLLYYETPIITVFSPIEYAYADNEKTEITKTIKNYVNDTLRTIIRQIMIHNAKPLLSLPLDFCTRPDKIVDNFLPPFDDYQTPYYISDSGHKGGKQFAAKIYNITLTGLSNLQLARVTFNKDDVGRDCYDDAHDDDEAIGTFVELKITNISSFMNFNDSSVKFNQIQMERLNEVSIVNATSTGRINVFHGHRYKIIPIPNDPTFSCYDSMWIMEKLEDILENSLYYEVMPKF